MSDKIYDPEYATSEADLEAFAEFAAVVRQLRRDCPWDREQTHESVRHLLIEETYEAIDAIDAGDWHALKQELGDVLLHVVFHSAIAEQHGTFSLRDVIATETEKLIRRHPHVFEEVDAEDIAAVTRNWEEIKKQEKGEASGSSVLAGVPSSLPALLQAHRMQQKAAGVGFDFETAEQAWGKVEEELAEFEDERASSEEAEQLEEEFGDLLFALVNFARLSGLNAGNALRATNRKFARRIGFIEQELAAEQRSMQDMTLGELEELWQQAKHEDPQSLSEHTADSSD